MRIAEFLSIRWTEPGEPLIEPPPFSPIIADPSFLFPAETPDGDWQIFAHSAFGIHRHSSPDGLSWKHRGIAIKNAMRAFVRPLPEDGYALYYESYPPLALAATAFPIHPKWKSRIALSESRDLVAWSRGDVIISPDKNWATDEALGASVSNPCVIQARGEWRLYFSASLSWIEDCGFCEPLHLAMARGASPRGPFTFPPDPLSAPELREEALEPAIRETGASVAEDSGTVTGLLGQGSIKVVPMDDGYVGLQNKIYRDPSGRSRSAIFILRSEDGLSWLPARSEPLLAPAISGWTSSHVYACDCRFREADGRWYLYFNARDGWRIGQGKERIGRIVGTEQKRICGGSLGGSTPAGRKES